MILPSVLAAKKLNLFDEINDVLNAGASGIHLDIMDNHYVPNLSFGPDFAVDMRSSFPNLLIDVHLMVSPVDACIEAFAQANVSRIAIHPETTPNLGVSIHRIQSFGILVGLVLNPDTPIKAIEHHIKDCNFVLFMTVKPGFGNQTFMPEVLPKIKTFKATYPEVPIAVDGGVNTSNLPHLAQAGAQQFIMGSAIFKTTDYTKTISAMYKMIGQ